MDEDDYTYLQRLYRITSQAVRDPLSKTTRERQRLLLVAVVLTLGLSFFILNPHNFKVDGGDISISPQNLTLVSAAATLYLTVLFAVGALQELNAERLRSARHAAAYLKLGKVILKRKNQREMKLNQLRTKREEILIQIDAYRSSADNLNVDRLASLEQQRDQLDEETTRLELASERDEAIVMTVNPGVWNQAFRFRKSRALAEVYLPLIFGIGGVVVPVGRVFKWFG